MDANTTTSRRRNNTGASGKSIELKRLVNPRPLNIASKRTRESVRSRRYRDQYGLIRFGVDTTDEIRKKSQGYVVVGRTRFNCETIEQSKRVIADD